MNPRGVMIEGIHDLNQSWPPDSNVSAAVCVVDPDTGALHHYRNAMRLMPPEADFTAQRFKDDIVSRVLEARQRIDQLFLNGQ